MYSAPEDSSQMKASQGNSLHASPARSKPTSAAPVGLQLLSACSMCNGCLLPPCSSVSTVAFMIQAVSVSPSQGPAQRGFPWKAATENKNKSRSDSEALGSCEGQCGEEKPGSTWGCMWDGPPGSAPPLRTQQGHSFVSIGMTQWLSPPLRTHTAHIVLIPGGASCL